MCDRIPTGIQFKMIGIAMMKTFIFHITALMLFTGCSPSSEVVKDGADTTSKKDNVMPNIIVESENDFESTEERLLQAIEDKGLKLFVVIDHGEGAQSVGQDIGQSKIFIFGNPKAGTPLIVENSQMGLELPLKILITARANEPVQITYTQITSIAQSYGIEGKDELLGKISENLEALAATAATP